MTAARHCRASPGINRGRSAIKDIGTGKSMEKAAQDARGNRHADSQTDNEDGRRYLVKKNPGWKIRGGFVSGLFLKGQARTTDGAVFVDEVVGRAQDTGCGCLCRTDRLRRAEDGLLQRSSCLCVIDGLAEEALGCM
jgi:hypothetical protein